MKVINPDIFIVLDTLNSNNYEAFIVGGAIRNYLLNKPITDYDITTNASKNVVKMLFSDYKTYDIGKKHGTVSLIINNQTIEITPYRKEMDYLDHRHPSKISFNASLKEDLKRRDFTINALCMDKDGKIIDYFNGLKDLNNKIIKAIGNPSTRFNEDALRILRAIRFKAKLNFEIDEKTNKQIYKHKDLLNYVSAERKKDELLQILSCVNGFKLINEYIEVFNTFMPFNYTNRKINNFSNPLYSLAYLLKDLEKINLKSLKYSNQEIDLINHLIASTKININDDYQFIKALSNIYQKHVLTFLNEYHRKNYSLRYKSLKKYMMSINEIDIDGKQIEKYGYKGKDIGRIKAILLDKIHRKRLINNNSNINKYLKENIL